MFFIKIGQKLTKPLLFIVCILLIGILQLGFIFLILALLPSIVAYYFDTSLERTSSRTIFACNLAGVIPAITPIFASGLKFKNYDIGGIVGNPRVWLFAYGFAAAGWAMIFLSNHIAHFIVVIKHKLQTTMLEYSQAKLLEEWGEPVRKLTDRREKKEDTAS